MTSVFTKVLQGELPGRFVFRDDRCAVFLTIAPINPGHLLVVPVEEVDHWDDLEPDLAAHLFQVAQRAAKAVKAALAPTRVALIIAGMEVPHAHLHVIGIDSESELSFSRARTDTPAEELDEVQRRLTSAFV
jgi:diadenosine tetraphosphate (Ap4A) HIT family hydrolase